MFLLRPALLRLHAIQQVALCLLFPIPDYTNHVALQPPLAYYAASQPRLISSLVVLGFFYCMVLRSGSASTLVVPRCPMCWSFGIYILLLGASLHVVLPL